MKYIIPLVAIMAVAVVGTISVTGFSAATMMTASSPVMTSSSNMMGHLEYTLVDANGNIKAYAQTDNLVTTLGDRCAAELIFENDSTDNNTGADCTGSTFQHIGISNTTLTVSDSTDLSANETIGGDNTVGIMAVIDVGSSGVTIDAISAGAGNVGAVITNSAHPFTFSDDTSLTNMNAPWPLSTVSTEAQSSCNKYALRNVTEEPPACTGMPTGEILAGQSLSALVVSDGDSLTITWTVDLGAASS